MFLHTCSKIALIVMTSWPLLGLGCIYYIMSWQPPKNSHVPLGFAPRKKQVAKKSTGAALKKGTPGRKPFASPGPGRPKKVVPDASPPKAPQQVAKKRTRKPKPKPQPPPARVQKVMDRETRKSRPIWTILKGMVTSVQHIMINNVLMVCVGIDPYVIRRMLRVSRPCKNL